VKQRSPKIWATSIIFGKLAKESNHPLGENSPNLVTLMVLGLKLIEKMANSIDFWRSMLYEITIFGDFDQFSAKNWRFS
jgi:hypothetical protein